MEVGINYPSGPGTSSPTYGWDFGVGPWGAPNWKQSLAADLRQFREIGFVGVRWFILGDGLTYGTPRDGHAPRLEGNEWRFDPPRSLAGSNILEDFQAMLEIFRQVNAESGPPIRLLPSLIDFLAFFRGAPVGNGWVKQGRAELVRDPAKRQLFLQTVLKPLLDLTYRPEYRNLIYAWELMNEPEWSVYRISPEPDRTIPVEDMRAFIREGAAMINTVGYDASASRGFFRSTVGFALYPTLIPGPIGWGSSSLGLTLHQFHHYSLPPLHLGEFFVPNPLGVLPPNVFDPRWPCIIGEIATGSAHNPWPELSFQNVYNRLVLCKQRGYPATFVWSARRPPEPDQANAPQPTAWTDRVRDEIRQFIQGSRVGQPAVAATSTPSTSNA